MSIICPKCKSEIPDESLFCMKCGHSFSKDLNESSKKQNNTSKKKNKIRRFIAGGCVLMLGVLIGVIIIFFNMNPVDKYAYLFQKGENDKAIEIYNDEIKDDKELSSELTDKQNTEIDSIYDKFKANKLSYDDAKEKIQKYLEYTPSKTHANNIKQKIENLNSSRDAYNIAEENEKNNDIETALKNYRAVIKEDTNYENAQNKITELLEMYKTQCLSEADGFIQNRQYDEAIKIINKVISYTGKSEELENIRQQYNDMKSEQYAKVEVVGKTVTPQDAYNSIYYYYVNNVFDITNNSDKPIKGIEGELTVNDLFDKKILLIKCDFTGQIIQPGETYRKTGLSYKCNEFESNDMKYYNTDFSDLKFKYKINQIVYEDGTTITPEE